jgi:inorganic pyrophosphatase
MQGSLRLVLSLAVLLTLCLCSTPLLADDRHLVRDIPPRADAGLVNVVVEIPAGTNAKWEVVKESGKLEWEQRGGRPRVVDYLAYPGNYGMVPRTLLPKEFGGDGDPLDVIVLGPALERGSVAAVRLIGVLELFDGGEQDDKLIAVRPGAPLGDVASLVELDERYVGISQIVKLWFANYKGPGEMEAKGFGDPKRASEILESAIAAYSEQKR